MTKKNREIERKFLISEENLPDLSKASYMDMTQGYLPNFNDKYVFRLRQVIYMNNKKVKLGDEYFQAIKGDGAKDRPEFEDQIWKDTFYTFWPLCDKFAIHKHRYEIIEKDNIIVYLDIYKNQHKGLYTVEVEFDTLEECDAFKPLSWFGREVTEEREYKNVIMALEGLPKLLI